MKFKIKRQLNIIFNLELITSALNIDRAITIIKKIFDQNNNYIMYQLLLLSIVNS